MRAKFIYESNDLNIFSINIDGKNLPINIIPKNEWPEGKNDPTEFSSEDKIVRVRGDYDYKKDPLNWLSHELIHYLYLKNGIEDDQKIYPTNNTEKAAYIYQFKKFKQQGIKNLDDIIDKIGKRPHKKILKKYWEKAIYESLKNDLKIYDIIIPPTTKKDCVNILLNDFKDQVIEYGDDAQMYFKTSNKPYGEEELKNGKVKIEMNKLDLQSLQHEVIHYIQGKKYPEMFKGAPKGEKFWSTIFDVTDSHKKYLSLPYEIMAYAFNEIKKPKGLNPLKNKNNFISKSEPEKYEEIGGKVFELFKFYVEKYREYYK